jgi:hypothetical protein
MINIEQELECFLDELSRTFGNEIREIGYEYTRPSFMYRIIPYKDGEQWCALLGQNVQDGIVGFGDTPARALRSFDDAYYGR